MGVGYGGVRVYGYMGMSGGVWGCVGVGAESVGLSRNSASYGCQRSGYEEVLSRLILSMLTWTSSLKGKLGARTRLESI